jgi:hypothetical protein
MPQPAFTKEKWWASFGEQDPTLEYATPVAATKWIGKVKTGSGLTAKQKLMQMYFSGGGRLPFEAADLGSAIEGLSIAGELQDGFFPALAFGTVDDQGTASGASTTLTALSAIGSTSLAVASGAGIANLDFVQVRDVGAAGIAEIRQVTAGGGTATLTLDKAIRRAKASGATVQRVIAPFTHTLRVVDNFPIPFTLQTVYRPGTPQELAHQYAGMIIQEITLTQDIKELLNFAASCIGSRLVNLTPPATLPTVKTTKSYRYADAVYTYFGATLNGVVGHGWTLRNGGAMEHWSRSPLGEFPAEYVPGRFVMEHTITVIARDNTLSTQLINRATGLSATIVYTRGANDTLTISMTGGVILEAPHDAPDEGKIQVPLKWLPGEVQLAFVDANAYY